MSLCAWRRHVVFAAAAAVLAVSGCKSAVIAASVTNGTGSSVSEVEIDYPSASFGTSTLATGDAYHYKFEIIGDGPMKASWMDAAHKNHTVTGPTVSEGQHGTVAITLKSDGTAVWEPQLSH